jgi:GAF domain-containing protein
LLLFRGGIANRFQGFGTVCLLVHVDQFLIIMLLLKFIRDRSSADMAQRSCDRRPANIWLLPVVILAVLITLTLALWKAELAIAGRAAPRSPAYVLWGGLSMSVILAVAVLQALLHRVAVQERTLRHLEAIERLNALSTAISAQISSGTALDELAQSSRRLLSMERAGVCMVDESAGTLQIIASTGNMPPDFPRKFDLAHLPACRHCLETNTIIFDTDIRNGSRPYNIKTLHDFGVVSMVLIPLRLNNRPIGLVTLSSPQPHEFTDLDRRIAQLLASQASVIFSNAQLYNKMKSALESRTRLLRQRQALSAANAVIQANDSIEESLRQITRLVPAALGADVSGVSLVSGSNRESVLVAISPPYENLIGMTIGANAVAEQAFAGRKPVILPHAQSDNRLHPGYRKLPDFGSMLFAPMFRTDREPLGILSLGRKQTGTFSHEQIEMIQTFSALAAVAIENARLLEQTRRDGQAKTELLRELNHRVKNNLTGIVALLEMNAPEMPDDVRQWLKRATDRIRIMAGAHQLFTGGMERVALQSLVAQTLATVAVSKPAGVAVQIELDHGGLTFGTEQAVGLAMVLHELCYNAFVHGLRDGGVLTIRARNQPIAPASAANGTPEETPGSTVVIEVINDGSAYNEETGGHLKSSGLMRPGIGSGHGLDLVAGLVRRELKGKFKLCPRAEGGAIATVEFPFGDGNS